MNIGYVAIICDGDSFYVQIRVHIIIVTGI